jgi:hypothetical protein
MHQHEGLTLERWRKFPAAHQVLMIANELHRARNLSGVNDAARRQGAYERALFLTDLTIRAQTAHGFRRELLRFRDLLAAFYLDPSPPVHEQAALLKALLLLTPESALQREPLGLS